MKWGNLIPSMAEAPRLEAKEPHGDNIDSGERRESAMHKIIAVFGWGKDSGRDDLGELEKLAESGNPRVQELLEEGRQVFNKANEEIEAMAPEAEKEIGTAEAKTKKTPPKGKKIVAPIPDPRKRSVQHPGFGAPKDENGKNIISDRRKDKNPIERNLKLFEGIKRLDAFNAIAAEQLGQEGVFVDNELRITKEEEYVNAGLVTSGQLAYCRGYVIDMEAKFAAERSQRAELDETIIFGEQMEKLVAALFYKMFNGEYIVARTNRFDDISGGIDMILVHRETGKVIGAVDAVVGNDQSERVQQKQTKAFEKTQKGTGKIVYGIGRKDGKTVLQSHEGVPVFCLDLSKKELIDCISNVDLRQEGFSEQEQKIVGEFLKSMGDQLDEVKKLTGKAGVDKFQEEVGVMKGALAQKIKEMKRGNNQEKTNGT